MSKTIANRERLRDTFKAMDPHKAQSIRESYYKAVEGLYGLQESLEGTEDSDLVSELQMVLSALSAMRTSQLGRVL